MSKRFLSYITLVLLVYALFSFTAYEELLFLLVIMLILPVLSFLLLLIGRYFVRVNIINFEDKVYRTEQFTLQLEVENRGPFYFPLVKIEFNHPNTDDVLQVSKPRRRSRTTEDEEFATFAEMAKTDDLDASTGDKVFRFYKSPHRVSRRKILSFALPPRSLLRNNLVFTSSNKGSYNIGTDSIILKDLFGFFYLPLPKSSRTNRQTKASTTKVSMDIYPNPNKWRSPDPGQLQEPEQVLISTHNKKVSNEVDTIANVRDYQRGDRMKQIHWKLSARTGTWLSREFEDPRQGGILFVIDPKLPDSSAAPKLYANQAAEVFAANIRHFSRTEGPLNLLVEEDLYFAAGEGHEPINFYEQLMYWKPQIRSNDKRARRAEFKAACNVVENRLELTDTIMKQLRSKVYRAVVVLSARMNDELTKELIRIQKIGSQVIFIFLHNEPDENVEEILKPILRARIRTFPTRVSSLVPYVNTELEEKQMAADALADEEVKDFLNEDMNQNMEKGA